MKSFLIIGLEQDVFTEMLCMSLRFWCADVCWCSSGVLWLHAQRALLLSSVYAVGFQAGLTS